VGVDRTAAAIAVGIILQFCRRKGPADKAKALLDKFGRCGNRGGTARFRRYVGGGIIAGSRMMAAGLSMGQVQAVTRETIAYAREKAGEDAVGEIVGAIPGLGQFV
jgi:hypothetical protein